MLNYLAQSEGKIELSTIQQIATKIIDNNVKITVMTWAESLKQEGWQEGRQEGRQEGWQEGRKEGLQEGLQEGELRGIRKGNLIGRIVTLMERHGLPAPDDRELHCLSIEQLEQRFRELATK